MALPTLTKTWQHNVNNGTGVVSTIDINRTFLRGMKNALIGFASSPWAMRYSSNSVTAGTAGDGVDRITTNANLVWANAGSAHSWFVLRQSGVSSAFELLVSCESASGTGSNMVFATSHVGFTGGSTTARPTATDEFVILGGAAFGVAGPASQVVWHAMQSTDGEVTRIYSYVGGAAAHALKFEKPYQPSTGWANPSVCYVGSSINCLSHTTLGASAGSLSARIGSKNAAVLLSCEGAASSSTNTGFAQNNAYMNLANEVSGEWTLLPIGIASPTTGVRGRHGTLQDEWFACTGSNPGDTYPSGTSRLFAQFGNLVVPWNGTVPLLS